MVPEARGPGGVVRIWGTMRFMGLGGRRAMGGSIIGLFACYYMPIICVYDSAKAVAEGALGHTRGYTRGYVLRWVWLLLLACFGAVDPHFQARNED